MTRAFSKLPWPYGALAGLVLIGLLSGRSGIAAETESRIYVEDFDGTSPSWQIHQPSGQAARFRVLSHRRNRHNLLHGRASENLEIDSPATGLTFRMSHRLPPSRVIDDLKLSLWFRSNRNGARLHLRVVFPHQQNPQTGEGLTTLISGDQYSKAGHWQHLTCTTLQEQIRSQLILLRARLKTPDIDSRGLFVDRVVLLDQVGMGPTEYFIDDLRFGPIVSPRNATTVDPVVEKTQPEGPPVQFRLGQLLVEKRPFFPRIVPYHDEPFDGLRQVGLNTVWVPDFRDTALLTNLRQEGFWMAASPPRALSPTGTVLKAGHASLVPFSVKTAPILFWYLGTRIPTSEHEELMNWIDQVRTADRRFRRPLMADVTGHEFITSRDVAMLGGSRHVLHTSYSLQDYRDWLIRKSELARPGSFFWTWIQTEPDPAIAQARHRDEQSLPVVEPEQIRLQVYAALSAGCRGIGYWKSTSLDEEGPGAVERRLAMAQLNLELQLLEPWLATGTLVDRVPCQLNPQSPPSGRRAAGSANSWLTRNRATPGTHLQTLAANREPLVQDRLEAVTIRSEHGRLLLPVWYQRDAQYVPGRMIAHNLSIVVPGVPETASAWEVTTTHIRSLPTEKVAGGMKITLDRFNQTTAVILSSDRSLVDELKARTQRIRERSSRIAIDLAKAKLERVRQVDQELRSLGVGHTNAPQILTNAGSRITEAMLAHQREDYHRARMLSADCCQLLRILQRAYWEDAVGDLSSPNSSPHTICFQTLPDHWRMVARLQSDRMETGEDLLRSGDFEDVDTLIAQGWRHSQNEVRGIRADAELYPLPQRGNYCLRIAAVPEVGKDSPPVIRQSLVTVTTPPLPVRSGQIVHIRGWVRVSAPISGTLDGAMLFDSIGGPAGALRWRKAGPWQPFELIREIPHSTELKLTIVLNGLGEIQFDNLQIIPHTLRPADFSDPDASPDDDEGNSLPSALDFWQHLPKLNPLKSKD